MEVITLTIQKPRSSDLGAKQYFFYGEMYHFSKRWIFGGNPKEGNSLLVFSKLIQKW